MKESQKTICLLGSTGSIGVQSLDVAEKYGYKISALAANRSVAKLEEQCRRFKPDTAYISEPYYSDLKTRLADTATKIVTGDGALEALTAESEGDTVINALMGIRGLRPTLSAIEAKKDVALANKETLVAGGEIVMSKVAEKGVKLLPVDSEHSAIFQCLQGGGKIKRILLTASGGPFYGKTYGELKGITPADALKHPNWSMGQKITIDSSSLMNKGLEFIEAMHLFNVLPEQIEVIIHRESVIHSMVEFEDNAVIAQLGSPDMRLCIQYALTYPNRAPSLATPLDFKAIRSLSFDVPDEETFSLLALAKRAAAKGGSMPAVMNGANEAAVALFLDGKIKYTDIFEAVTEVTENAPFTLSPNLEQIEEADTFAREQIYSYFG